MNEKNAVQQGRKVERLLHQWNRTIGRTIKSTREEIGLSQEELGEKMAWSRVTQANIEQGRRLCSTAELILISKQMGVDPVRLLKRVLSWDEV